MVRGRTARVLVQQCDGASVQTIPDELIVEEPLQVDLDGHVVATTMRTPGNDFELACGLCHTEGLLAAASVRTVRYCGGGPALETDFNAVTVDTGGEAPVPAPRLGVATSSCGLCGSTAIEALRERVGPLAALSSFRAGVLREVMARVQARQTLFSATGGVHAAAAFSRDGEPVVVREDVGRHNAVDKVVGRLLLDGGLPASTLGLFVSGRASFEIVQKAWAAGFAVVLAVSAPSALAVEAAQQAGLGLVGFLRGRRMNVYVQGPMVP